MRGITFARVIREAMQCASRLILWKRAAQLSETTNSELCYELFILYVCFVDYASICTTNPVGKFSFEFSDEAMFMGTYLEDTFYLSIIYVNYFNNYRVV